MNTPGWTTGQHLRTPSGSLAPGWRQPADEPHALRSGGGTQTRQPGWAQEGWGSPCASAECPCPPSPFPIPTPPPSFLFLFWGLRNFLFSLWFKMACWSQLEAQREAGRPRPRHTNREEGEGGSVPPGGGRAHRDQRLSPDKASSPAPQGFWGEPCSRPQWPDPAAVTLHSHCCPLPASDRGPEGFLPSSSSCFLPGTLALETADTSWAAAHRPTSAHTHTGTHTHTPVQMAPPGAELLRPGLGSVLMCACLGGCVCGGIKSGVHTCMCVQVSPGEHAGGRHPPSMHPAC